MEPVFEYDHSQGASITGGYVALDDSILRDKYIFGDFISGRIWAMDWQEPFHTEEILMSGLNISTFARNAKGEIFVADFGSGDIYRLGP